MTSTTMANGAMSRNTATFGIRAKLPLAGLLTATVIGTGSARGAGPGLTIHRGASRRTTMAAGTISVADGAGARARLLGIRSTGPGLSAFVAVGFVLGAGGSWGVLVNCFCLW